MIKLAVCEQDIKLKSRIERRSKSKGRRKEKFDLLGQPLPAITTISAIAVTF